MILALGLGANTALFTVTNAVLLRPLPFPASDRLVVLRLFDPEFQGPYPSFPVNAAHIAVWRERCASCEDLAAINGITTTLIGGVRRGTDGASVSASFFELLGITPVFGRGLRAGEDSVGQYAVTVISHALWMRRFGGNPSAIGQTVQLDRELVEIVGILPQGAPIPGPRQLGDLVRLPPAIDVFRPMAPSPETLRSAGDLNYGVIARARPGVSPEALRSELDALEPAISKQTDDDGHKRAVVVPLQQIVTGQVRTPLDRSLRDDVRRSLDRVCESGQPAAGASHRTAATTPCGRRSAPGAARSWRTVRLRVSCSRSAAACWVSVSPGS